MSGRFDYEIITEKIDPIGGVNHYAARLDFLVRRTEGGKPERVPATGELGEHWGATEEEAYKKMKQAVDEWIARQP